MKLYFFSPTGRREGAVQARAKQVEGRSRGWRIAREVEIYVRICRFGRKVTIGEHCILVNGSANCSGNQMDVQGKDNDVPQQGFHCGARYYV